MNKFQRGICGLGLILWGMPVFCETDLVGAVGQTLARNPSLKDAQLRVESASKDLGISKSLRYPRLSIRTVWTRGDNPVYVFGSLLEQKSFGANNFAIDSLNNPDSLDNFKNSLDVGMPLFTGFEQSHGEKIQKLRFEQMGWQFETTRQQLRYQVIERYLSVLCKRQKMLILDERVQSSLKEIDNARQLNARGLVLGSDYFSAQAILSSLKARLSQAEMEWHAEKEMLAILTGGSASEYEQLVGNLESPCYSVEPMSGAADQALNQRPDMRQAKLQAQMSDLMMGQSVRSFLPKIEAFASLETNTDDFSSNPFNHLMGVRSQFPIGDPGYFLRRSQAKKNHEIALTRQNILEENIRIDVSQAQTFYRSAAASLPFVESSVAESKKSLELLRPLYKEGRQSILDLLKAEDGLAAALTVLADSQFAIHAGFAKMKLAAGQLDDDVVELIMRQLERSK